MTPINAANTLQVSDTRLASCYRALGFRYVCQPVIHERSGRMSTQFLFELQSLRFTQLDLRSLNAAWKSGELQQKEPLHLLCVMMRAQQNYDALLRWLKEGVTHVLRSIPGEWLTIYEPGPLAHRRGSDPIDDMRLAACVGLLGCPVVDIAATSGGHHTFHVQRQAYAVRLSTGEMHLHDARRLLQRAPTKEDPLRLRMEAEQPLHPLCIAYDALYNRTELKRELSRPHLLLIDEPSAALAGTGGSTERISARQALIDINAPGHVMDHVTAHMKAPPLHWS